MKPILFNTEMVRAILDGRKTQTRGVVRFPEGMTGRLPPGGNRDYLYYPGGIKRPAYQKGDVLWVRETWKQATGDYAGGGYGLFDTYVYKADGKEKEGYPLESLMIEDRWRPSIHMPREAARLFLRVTYVRVQRLQDITIEDINSEGIDIEPPPICRDFEPTEEQKARFNSLSEQQREKYLRDLATRTYMGWCKYADDLFLQFKKVWDNTINSKDLDRFGWDANPWAFAYTFERIEKGDAE